MKKSELKKNNLIRISTKYLKKEKRLNFQIVTSYFLRHFVNHSCLQMYQILKGTVLLRFLRLLLFIDIENFAENVLKVYLDKTFLIR